MDGQAHLFFWTKPLAENASRPRDESTNLLRAVTADAGKYPAGNARTSPDRRGSNGKRGKLQTRAHASLSGFRQGQGAARKILSTAPSISQSNGTRTQGNGVRWGRLAFDLTRRWRNETGYITVSLNLPSHLPLHSLSTLFTTLSRCLQALPRLTGVCATDPKVSARICCTATIRSRAIVRLAVSGFAEWGFPATPHAGIR